MIYRLLSTLFGGARSKPKVAQQRFDVAVVVQTVLRPSLEIAVNSIFEQDFEGSVHILIGIDKRLGDPRILKKLQKQCPHNMQITVFDPGYSTSVRHGGVYTNHFGGALRTILSYMANSRYVAYLDDDDWFGTNHLSSLHQAIQGVEWAFSHRWYVNPFDMQPICVDAWENLGPGRGIFTDKFGGFACPSSLMLDKLAAHFVLPSWCLALALCGEGEDRVLFDELKRTCPRWRCTDIASVYCVIKPEDAAHSLREGFIVSTGYDLGRLRAGTAHGFSRI